MVRTKKKYEIFVCVFQQDNQDLKNSKNKKKKNKNKDGEYYWVDTTILPFRNDKGEVYQYVVKAKPGYEGKYDLAALRDIQDLMNKKILVKEIGGGRSTSYVLVE